MSGNLISKRSCIDALSVALMVVILALFVAGCGPAPKDWRTRVLPDRVALRSALQGPDHVMLREIYARRDYQPIWIGGETRTNAARELVSLLETSDKDGLVPARYGAAGLRERLDRAWRPFFGERARVELLLTTAYIEYVRDLHTPAARDDLAYTDSDLQPSMRDRAEIARLLAAPVWPQPAIKDATRMNVLYVQMRDALAQQRRNARRNKADEQRLLLNLDRLRALPSKLGERFVLVDVAANRLWLYEHDQPVDSMRVVVGAPNEQTPQMAALIRYAIYNPFWNVPPDLTRDHYAPRIAANLSALTDLRMDPWSGFTANAQILNPRAVNWKAVAQGQDIGWLRQRPGPTNSMGAAKFMLPNELGIYLHDSPQRELFDKTPRFFSAGCIRVEDYRRLSRWLFRGAEIKAQGPAAEQRFDLPEPVPVYIIYLTARADGDVVQVQPDVYGRDRPQTSAASPSPGAAAPAVPKPVPAQSSPVPAPTVAAPKAPALQPAPALPGATFERSPGAAAPTSLRMTPPPQSAPVAPANPSAVVAKASPAPPAPAPVSPSTPAGPVGACRIQAGVFSQRANADALVKSMRPLGDVRLTEMNTNGKVLYSVVLAGLSGRQDAESALSKLNSLNGGKLGARIVGCRAAAN